MRVALCAVAVASLTLGSTAGCTDDSTAPSSSDGSAADVAPDGRVGDGTTTPDGAETDVPVTGDAVVDSVTAEDASDATLDAEPEAVGPDAVADADAATDADAVADAVPDAPPAPADPDLNGDGTLNVLVIGTSSSIRAGYQPWSPDPIASQLQSILDGDGDVAIPVNVVAEDIHHSALITTGYGQGGDTYDWTYRAHSLTQYFYWPEGQADRMANLKGEGAVDWDHVVIAADPYIIATMPGYYALGVAKVAAAVAEGGAQPHVLMQWGDSADADHFAEFAARAAAGAPVAVSALPAGPAWDGLPGDKKDTSSGHPSPNGAYVAAATIYAALYGQSASASDHDYDDVLADAALTAVEATTTYYSGASTFVSPFAASAIADRVLNYNHTGTSSENGILGGLNWVLGKANVQLVKNGDPPINFNYGRANTEFEANKRYQIDPAQYDFSLGFPMQDHSNNGDTSMLYGLDGRRYDAENGTDLGVARFMMENGELPYARAIPLRTLHAQLQEAIPGQSAYSDGWHMSKDLDKAAGAFMYTLLTGHCALDAEPEDTTSAAWRQWVAHKTGYETAWKLMHFQSHAPCFKVLPESAASTSVTLTQDADLAVSFANAPTADVTVTLTTDNEADVSLSATQFIFGPADHAMPQVVTMTALPGDPTEETYTVTATTASADPAFDGLTERWTYTLIRE